MLVSGVPRFPLCGKCCQEDKANVTKRLRYPTTLGRSVLVGLLAGICMVPASMLSASQEDAAIRLANPRTTRWQVGVVVRARGTTTGIVATMPVPMDWPEQDVKVVDEDVSPQVKDVKYRDLDGGVRQMVVTIPRLGAGDEAVALVTLEIVKRDIASPPTTSGLRVVKRLIHRKVHPPQDGNFLVEQGDDHPEPGKARCKVGRAIQRIHHPGIAGSPIQISGFFRNNVADQ